MIADFFTKPSQGSLFSRMRDIIMGLASFPEEERVEIQKNINNCNITSDKISEPVTKKSVTYL